MGDDGPELTAETLAESEKLAGIAFTPAEREQILRTLKLSLAIGERSRAAELPNGLPPALGFRPDAPLPEDDTFSLETAGGALPGADLDLAYASLAALSAGLARGEVTSLRLTELALDRLRRIGPELQCVVTLCEERALSEAHEADRERAAGRVRGPLHGIPYGAKDLLDSAGIATTWGAAPYRERVPQADAHVIARLREAGAVLVAKLTLGSLAMGDVWFGGRTRNPWNPEQGSSGSSAGSAAAVAAGLVPFAIGSETLGSIVEPSLVCGCAGLRPSYGRVGRSGAMALVWSLDKLGPMARSGEDALLVLREIHGADPADPDSRTLPLGYDARAPLAGMRVGYREEWFAEGASDPAERDALEALRSLGVELVPVEIPELPYDGIIAEIQVESAAAFEELTRSGRDDELVEQGDHAWPNQLRAAWFWSAARYVQILRARRLVMEAMGRLFADVEAVMAPRAGMVMNFATNWSGHPALTLRSGFRKDGTAQGVVLFGRLFREGRLVRLGAALEEALGVRDRRPPVGS